jgi:hypothetical protein
MPESFVGRKYVFIILPYLAIARRTCRRETKKGTLKITAAANVGGAALELGEYEVDQANSERRFLGTICTGEHQEHAPIEY